jgi:hypothetical protein
VSVVTGRWHLNGWLAALAWLDVGTALGEAAERETLLVLSQIYNGLTAQLQHVDGVKAAILRADVIKACVQSSLSRCFNLYRAVVSAVRCSPGIHTRHNVVVFVQKVGGGGRACAWRRWWPKASVHARGEGSRLAW